MPALFAMPPLQPKATLIFAGCAFMIDSTTNTVVMWTEQTCTNAGRQREQKLNEEANPNCKQLA